MNTEIEVKFLDVDFGALRTKLTESGAVCEQPMRLMRRAVIEMPHHEEVNGFVRVRDEGNRVTLTYKQFESVSLHGAKELEVTVSDFDTTVALFKAAGWSYKSLQESRRETWKLDDVEVVLDEWPWLNPYIEIEGPSEEMVRGVATKLGFNWDEAVFGTVTEAYQVQYPDGDASQLINTEKVTFDNPLSKVISG